MSTVQSSLSWLRRTFAWSNSRQSWVERLGIALVLLGIAAAWWAYPKLDAVQFVMVVLLLALMAAILLRRGWLKLFGPVLFYDMVRTARRGRFVWMRFAYAVLLLFFLSGVWWTLSVVGALRFAFDERNQAARMAQSFFEWFMLIQFLLTVLLTPGYVAGAIAEEKDRKTLEYLLATDLRNREIVLSKLVSRLANLTLFLMTGLPILSFLQFLGGVDPNLVLAGFTITAFTMAGIAGISILNSTLAKRPRDAIAWTYLFLIVYYVISILLAFLDQGIRGWNILGEWALTIHDAIAIYNAGNIFSAIGKYVEASAMGSLATVIPEVLWKYGLFMGLIFVATTLASVLQLRAIALKQAHGGVKRSWSWRLIGRPSVGNMPMVWKEFFVEGGLRFNWIVMILLGILILASFSPFVALLSQYVLEPHEFRNEWNSLSMQMNPWIRFIGTALCLLMLLGVAVRAATTISGERDRDTFDALLSSPLDSWSIVTSKWLGSIFSVRFGFVWLGLIWALGVVTGGLHPLALPILMIGWFAYASFAAGVGQWFSLTCRSTLTSLMCTLLSLLVLGGGHWVLWLCCIPVFFFRDPGSGEAMGHVAMFQAGITPPAAIAFLSFPLPEFSREFGRSAEYTRMFAFCLFGIFFWAIAAAGVMGGTVARFRYLTNRRHEGAGIHSPLRQPQPPVQPAARVVVAVAEEDRMRIQSLPDPNKPPT